MASDIFLKIDDLGGPTKDAVHGNEIKVLGWSWGMSQLGTTHNSTGGGSGKVSINDITFQKEVDTTSTNLIQKCCNGTHFKEALFTMRKAGGEKAVEYLKIKLQDLIVSSVQTSVSPESETVIESVSLNFAKYTLTYTPQDTAGAPLAEMGSSWDIPANAPVG